ncbi:MAG: GNAT family N-acetyltransferase [Candidatus Dormibacter sp.]|uniref:GNAT family N-acetyltransferase n=1 Tax=Candidatus Dormibacter sp. TaxID=2973982 RepID=UPI000DB8D3F1|nr:MAG: GNAT family N-acetyltransferase [Candidatus Dormibacteraeota bacterium]
MGAQPELRTQRLLLRRWRESDRLPFAALNADPVVMEHFPRTLSRRESDAAIDRIEAHMAGHGFGLWATELVPSGVFIGFVGLWLPTFDAPFMPAVEVGWRLARHHWGQGYATEAARAVVAFGFDQLSLAEIVRSRCPATSARAMERVGMTHDAEDDFEQPLLPLGHPLRRHVLYRLRP